MWNRAAVSAATVKFFGVNALNVIALTAIRTTFASVVIRYMSKPSNPKVRSERHSSLFGYLLVLESGFRNERRYGGMLQYTYQGVFLIRCVERRKILVLIS